MMMICLTVWERNVYNYLVLANKLSETYPVDDITTPQKGQGQVVQRKTSQERKRSQEKNCGMSPSDDIIIINVTHVIIRDLIKFVPIYLQ